MQAHFTFTEEEQEKIQDNATPLCSDKDIILYGKKEQSLLPQPLIDQLRDFKNNGNDDGCLFISGCPIGRIPPTPSSIFDVKKEDRTSEFLLSLIAHGIGDPVAYRQDKNGQVFHNIFPTKKNEFSQTSEGSKVILESHTELAFHHFRPDFLILLGLRQDPLQEAKTMYLSAKKIVRSIPSDIEELLRQPLFITGIDESWMQYYGKSSRIKGNIQNPISLLSGPAHDPELLWDKDLMQGITPDANHAIEVVDSYIQKHLGYVCLKPGDLLVIDNKRAIHARSTFKARYNGNDRWIQRTLVLRDKSIASMDIENDWVINTDFSKHLI